LDLGFTLEHQHSMRSPMSRPGFFGFCSVGPARLGSRPMPDRRNQERGGRNRIVLHVTDQPAASRTCPMCTRPFGAAGIDQANGDHRNITQILAVGLHGRRRCRLVHRESVQRAGCGFATAAARYSVSVAHLRCDIERGARSRRESVRGGARSAREQPMDTRTAGPVQKPSPSRSRFRPG